MSSKVSSLKKMSDRVLPNASFNPDYQLHIVVVPEDAQQLVIKEEVPEELEEPEERSFDVNQQNPEPLNIKEEEELQTSLETEQLNVKNETDATKFTFPPVSIKTEDDEGQPLSSQLHQHQMEVRYCPSSSSDDQIEAGAGGEDREGVEIVWNPDLKTYEDYSNSSETEVSEDREEDEEEHGTNPDSQLKHLSDSGSNSDDGDKDWKESWTSESGVNTFSCSECGEQFSHRQSLQRHMTCHLGIWSSNGLANTKCVGMNEDVESQKEGQTKQKTFSCDDCGRVFNRKTNLNRHTRIHTGQKPFSCYFCGRRFSDKANFNRHVTIHTGQKLFSCDICGHRFSQEDELNSHVLIHIGQRPCSVCGQKFNQKTDLDRHMRIHTGQKPFGCDVCGQNFSRKTNLKTHMRIHTGQKPFACDVCERRFSDKANLNRHMKIHTGQKQFSCDVCEYRSCRKADVTTHMRVHTGKKPFACHVCEHRFSHRAHLNAHIRSHTEEKPA